MSGDDTITGDETVTAREGGRAGHPREGGREGEGVSPREGQKKKEVGEAGWNGVERGSGFCFAAPPAAWQREKNRQRVQLKSVGREIKYA